jgi:hypothetical protein
LIVDLDYAHEPLLALQISESLAFILALAWLPTARTYLQRAQWV